ncbi:FHIPEP family type III secretion protein [Streptomyces sp. NPDC059454]|uniref:FHIPEP family type III secretion protein n=1 Tax=Streptomyces sp. NPDC059454 TaxID=3346836 RepID=UPI0036D0C39D
MVFLFDSSEFSLGAPGALRLVELLASAYPEPEDIKVLVERVRIPRTRIDFSGPVDQIWPRVLRCAAAAGKLRLIVEEAAAGRFQEAYREKFDELLAEFADNGPAPHGRHDWRHAVASALTHPAPARSPILIALETETEPLSGPEFLTVEHHLVVTLGPLQVERVERTAGKALRTGASISEIIAAGSLIWKVLTAAQPRLDELRRRGAEAGLAQPVAWCGRSELLDRLWQPLLIAHTGTEGADGFLSVGSGGHYFMPLAGPRESRTMKKRSNAARPDVRCVDLRNAEPESRAKLLRGVASAEAALVLSFDAPAAVVSSLVTLVQGDRVSPTRAVVAFGPTPPDAGGIDRILHTLPFVSLADGALARTDLLDGLKEALRDYAGTRAAPCVVAAVRAAWIRCSLACADVAGLRSGLTWSSWAWIGLPLFTQRYDSVVPTEFPHVTALRSLTSDGRYFKREKGIPDIYKPGELARADLPNEGRKKFHFYLSGAGGSGKSCLLRFVHDEIRTRSNAIPVWYRVDAPSSPWREVERRIREETVRAVRASRFAGAVDEVMAPDGASLAAFLHRTAQRLRSRDPDFDEIVIFIDQLERTFESGDEPHYERLDTISRDVIQLLRTVGTGQGVRVFIASRKQYLPDFLGSSRTAEQCGLEFNILQSLTDSTESVEFVRSLIDWCREKKLVDENLAIQPDAAKALVNGAEGNPLNITLALIQLLSATPEGKITEKHITDQRPWEQLFALDLQSAARDDLDWYFLLAMAHARTEIVPFEDVWWRLRMVRPQLTQRVDSLQARGILERLWLIGHLGRTIHARPYGDEPARFVEFFHANLRDYLLRDVMARGRSGLDVEVPATEGFGAGTPPAWRALDRLADHAHDWDQIQQLLQPEDIRALITHRAVVVEPYPAADGGGRLPFQLLFRRSRDGEREKLIDAARECFVLSALVHEDAGRWAFEELFPDAALRVATCMTWLRDCPPGHRTAVLRYLVEVQSDKARSAVVSWVLDEVTEARHDVVQTLTDVLREPLYAGRYRNEVMAALLRTVLPAVHGDPERLPPQVRSFAVAACEGDGVTLRRALAYCAERLGDTDDPRMRHMLPLLTSASVVEQWLAEAAVASDYSSDRIGDRLAGAPGSLLDIAVGSSLRAVVDEARVADWSEALRGRIGVRLPDFQVVTGDCEADEIEFSSLRERISSNTFHTDRLCVLKRQWEAFGGTGPSDALDGYDDAVGEDVLWLPATALPGHLPFDARDFDTAVLDWLEAHCRRSFHRIFDSGLLTTLYRELEALSAGRPLVAVEPFRAVIADLVEEGALFPSRRRAMLEELARLDPADHALPELLGQKLREHMRADICRSVADTSMQVTALYLADTLEQALADRRASADGRRILVLSPADAEMVSAAVRRQFLAVLNDPRRPPPILATTPYLRHALAKLLHRFDPRLRVLSFTELDHPELILVPADYPVSVPRALEAPA